MYLQSGNPLNVLRTKVCNVILISHFLHFYLPSGSYSPQENTLHFIFQTFSFISIHYQVHTSGFENHTFWKSGPVLLPHTQKFPPQTLNFLKPAVLNPFSIVTYLKNNTLSWEYQNFNDIKTNYTFVLLKIVMRTTDIQISHDTPSNYSQYISVIQQSEKHCLKQEK